jgi:hypothetical protein
MLNCRKKAKQLIEQTSTRYSADADEIVIKHTKRWVAKHGSVTNSALPYVYFISHHVNVAAGEDEETENISRGKATGEPTRIPR